jgi:hypothetical protein
VEANVVGVGRLSRWQLGRLRRVLGLWPWLPLPLGVAYLLVIATKFSQLVAATYLNADYASAPVIGQLFGGSPAHRHVVLGQVGWFSTLIFELVTRWLPLHRQLWELAPYAMALASAALISWGAWNVAGRWAAAIAGVLVLCVGPQTLGLLLSLDDHTATWFSLALLGGLLVLLEARPAWLRTWLTGLIVFVVGAIVGANAASDLLLLGAGIAPVLLAAAGTWLLRPARASARAWWWVLGAVAVAGLGDALTRLLMRHENVAALPGLVHTQLASAVALGSNFALWWQSLMVLGDGNFFGQVLGFTSALQLTCAVLVIVGVVLIPRIVWREISEALSRRREHGGQVQAPRVAWCIFWASSAVLLSATYVFSSNPTDITSSRYLVGVVYAAAALVPLIELRRPLRRAAITAGTAILALTGLVTLLENQDTTSAGATYILYNQVARIAAREHVDVGYADYWDAAPLTWSTHFRLKVYPVMACINNAVLTDCRFYLHMVTSWYTPRPGERTFLIIDSAKPDPVVTTPFGTPSAEYQVGAMTMLVYPYDIAQKIVR